ncbi:hypothetical protein Daud_0898 [Candidatus Desulforudis audaxviator MP104C]|uniref:Uncharacterized protein n=1 Tax=Desulforudis audaxviator (strain MP104C) TaxID=477974 RepID=B1I356_DESAP|nr:hypothetical protein Daud_0898 [Candidatus Desulforudis audaxviator MP104C]
MPREIIRPRLRSRCLLTTQFIRSIGLLTVERLPAALKAGILVEQRSSRVPQRSVVAERWPRAVKGFVVAGAQAITGSIIETLLYS